MEKGVRNDREVVIEEKSEAIRTVTIRSVALFCTAVVTATILGVCVMGSVGIYQAQDKTISPTCPHCEMPETENKMMDMDMEKEMMMRMDDGQMMMERFIYNYESNVLLVHVPGNYSGNSAATVALDYKRSLIYASIHDEDTCIVLPWSEDLANAATEFMTGNQNEGEILDVVSSDINSMQLAVVGEIPAGYFLESTDVTVSALCAGKQTHWLEERSVAGRRRRRRSSWGWSFSISFWGVSFTFSW